MKAPHIKQLLFLSICCLLAACSTTQDPIEAISEKTPPQTTAVTSPKQPSFESFKQMNHEQQWNSFSPERRNYLRENPDVYPAYKSFIEASPELEEIVASTNAAKSNSVRPSVSPGKKKKTNEEWWNSFSEKRKKYMREHADEYPDFKEFIERSE